jgi:two-component system, oxyanion-binding sensor
MGALEQTSLRLGMVPLVDAAPLIVARDKGFFAREGLEVQLSVEASWASIRDKVVAGLLDGAQMLAPMPIAATLGIDAVGVPMVTAMMLSLNGNAVAVSEAMYQELGLVACEPVAAGQALRALLERDRAQGRRKRVFAHVFPFSAHHYELRYWLAASGIDPDRHLRLEVVPPPLMVKALRDGRIDACCVGAPWGAAAESASAGYRLLSSHQIWNNSPEKVFAVTRDWAQRHPNTHRAVVAALLRSCQWLDRPEHRMEAAQLLIDSGSVDAPPATLRAALDASAGEAPQRGRLVFHAGAANFPWITHAVWFIEQMRRWRQIDDEVDALSVAAAVYRTDIHRDAARRLGMPVPDEDGKSEGHHDRPWMLRTQTGDIAMGSDRFFDGQTFVNCAAAPMLTAPGGR